MESPSDFRERKLGERAKKIAQRIHNAGGVRNMNFIPLDAVCAPGTGGWKVPEPSKEALDHMAQFGYVTEEAPAPAPVEAAPVVPPQTDVAQAIADGIAAGVTAALAKLGLK
jgi:hypothetical protein